MLGCDSIIADTGVVNYIVDDYNRLIIADEIDNKLMNSSILADRVPISCDIIYARM